MPYKASQIPSGTEKVPKHGQAIFRSAFNAAYEKYGEERAHAIAWSAVKAKYKKKGDRWVSKDGYAVMHRLGDYDPDQPRVPAGESGGGQWASGSSGGGGGGELHLTKAEGLSEKPEIARAFGFGEGIQGIAGGVGGAEGELGAGTFGKSEPAGGAKASPGVPKELVKAIEDHVGGMGGEFGQHGSADLTRWLMLARKDQMLKLIDEMPANKRPALLLHKGDEKAGMPSVWLLGWSGTEQTDIHDHVRSEVGISVLRGNIANEWNHPPSGYLDTAKSPDGLRMPVNKDTLPEGTTVQLEAPYIHLMRGTAPSKASGERDISVHAYHPPLKQMHYFKSRGGALHYDGDWDEDRPPSEYSTRDCACCSLLDEAAGHPFRGNQYTTGESGGGTEPVSGGSAGERAGTGEHDQKVKAFLSLSSAKSVIRSAINETIRAGEHIVKHESEIAVTSGILAALTALGAPSVPAAICATVAGYAVHRVAHSLGIDAGAAHRLLKATTGGLRNMSERARRSGMHGGGFPEQALGFGDADDDSVSRSLRLLDDALNRHTLDELDRFIEEYESGRFHRDEEAGHPFRGNQYTTGESGGGKAEETGRERGGGEEVHPGKGYSKEAYVDEKGVIHTENVDDAARALSEGRKVELNQPRQVSTLLDKLGEIAQGAIAKGEKAPNFNLCDVSVKGTNLFCAETKGFTRIEMPQLEDTKGFLDYLKARGHSVKDGEEYAAHLRATQNELKGAQVAALAHFMETGIGKDGKVDKEAAAKLQERPIVISKDNYILDGHHSWAAKIGMDARDNILADDKKMNVRRVDTDIITLLYAADDFTGGKGKKSAKDRAMMDQRKQCPGCFGSGLDLEGDQCDECDGTGYIDNDDDDVEDGRRRQTDSIHLIENAVFVQDRDGKIVRKTKDGYLVANARIARTGIQLYDGAEIGKPDMGVVRVYRPESEVFSTKAMHSLANKPITLNHPPVMVDANNWDEYAVGHIGEEVARDGDSVRVPLVIMDSKAIEAYEKHGVKELSVGYSTDLRWGKGRTPDGEIYDAKQTAIRGNHLAVVPAARGGSRLKIGDDHQKGATDMVKILVDGQSIGFEDELAAKHVQNFIGSLQTQLDAAKKKNNNNNNKEGSAAEEEQESEKEERGEKDAAFAAMKGEVAALKKQLADALAKTDPKAIDAEAERRIDLLLKADAVMEGKADFKGKPDTEIVRTVVMAKMGDAAKDLSDAEMVGAFKILTANLKPRSGTDRLADSLSLLGHGGGSSDATNPKAIRDKAYSEYVTNTSNAWKNPRSAAQ